MVERIRKFEEKYQKLAIKIRNNMGKIQKKIDWKNPNKLEKMALKNQKKKTKKKIQMAGKIKKKGAKFFFGGGKID